jgi:hypothetical protein
MSEVRQPSADRSLIPHAVKRRGRYLPATMQKQIAPPFNIGRQTVTVLRGYAYDSRQAALEHAKAAIVRAESVRAYNDKRLAISRSSSSDHGVKP